VANVGDSLCRLSSPIEYIYICMCIDTFFVFIFCTATDCYVLQLEMRVRLICAIKFYLLTYL